jgi:hypothetical protein
VKEERALLAETIAAVERVAESLRLSVADVKPLAPMRPSSVDNLSRMLQKDVLSLFKSYEQLVDLLSNRLIRAMLAVLGENTKGWSARDAVRYMESRGTIQDAQRFLELVMLRNRLAHEYPMSAEKRAQRINDTLDMADVLLRAVEPLLFDASGLLADDETEAEDARAALAREIPDEIWVWGPDDDKVGPIVWTHRADGEVAPTLTENAFRHLFERRIAERIRAWEAWRRVNSEVRPIAQIIGDAFCGGFTTEQHHDSLAEIVVRATSTGLLIGVWQDFHDFNQPIA